MQTPGEIDVFVREVVSNNKKGQDLPYLACYSSQLIKSIHTVTCRIMGIHYGTAGNADVCYIPGHAPRRTWLFRPSSL